MIEKLGGRKFILACAILLMSFVLVTLRIEAHEHWVELAKWIMGIYAGANVLKGAVTKIK